MRRKKLRGKVIETKNWERWEYQTKMYWDN